MQPNAALDLAGVSLSYSGRRVLDGVSLTVTPGRVHALVGENGAGKSTLIRVACGLATPEAGSVTVGGGRLPMGLPHEAIRAGVGVVHQHFMLVPTMSVVDNVALGAEARRGILGLCVDRATVRRRIVDLSAQHALPVDPDAIVSELAVGERQRVEILKVLYRGARVLLLDEPTAVLSPGEVTALLATLRSLAAAGAAVLFVSHKLDEVFVVADDVTVLRRGRVVLSVQRSMTTADVVARSVVGGDLPARISLRAVEDANPRVGLTLARVNAPGITEVTLSIAEGEVVGVAGVEGNGQRVLAEVIAGLTEVTSGDVCVGAKNLAGLGVAARRSLGVGYVPEDREGTGLLPDLSIAENIALGLPDNVSRGGRLDRAAMETMARAVIKDFSVRPEDPWAPVASLSGGNQQKVLLGRELTRNLTVLVVAQPTRGVDLGSSAEIHTALRAARARGVAVLLVSSEVEELRALSDRIVVMRRGTMVGELTPAEATDTRLGSLMVGPQKANTP